MPTKTRGSKAMKYPSEKLWMVHNKRTSQMNVFFFLAFMVFFFSHSVNAESGLSGSISGRVIDSVTTRPVEYATISLIRQEDNKVINGVTTDNKGVFKLSDVPQGAYQLLIYFIGYETGKRSNIVISKANF